MKKIKTAIIAFISLFIMIMIISCNPSTSQAPDQEEPKFPDGTNEQQNSRIEITIENFAFHPDTLTISAGTTVIWRNNDSVVHTVTARDGSFDSRGMPGGSEFSHTFNEEGIFEYHCIPHSFMTGEIRVNN